MIFNPFIHGRSLTPSEMIGRQAELRFVLGRLARRQSTAVIGQPHTGKTTLLGALADEGTRRELAGDHFAKNIFSYVDAHMLRGVQSQAAFWQQVLRPLQEILFNRPPKALITLQGVYEKAKNNQFSTFELDQLFRNLNQKGYRLILLLDEFDDFLANKSLHTAEFYGSLRSLGSRNPGLALVLGTRQELERLNYNTQDINPHGSPYFNIYTELHLGPFSEQALATLLAQAGDQFDESDGRFVKDISGSHPFLAQAAAAVLWDAVHLDGGKLAGEARYRVAAEAFYDQTRTHFSDTWKSMSNEGRKGVTAIGLMQLPYLVSGRFFHVESLAEHIEDYTPELEKLARSGLVVQEADGGEWQIGHQGFLWWLADELRRHVRSDDEFVSWLQREAMDGMITRGEKEAFGNAARGAVTAVAQGVPMLIQGFVGKIVGG